MAAYRDFEERFWEKIDVRGDNDCWEWLACKGRTGYGRIRLPRKRETGNAHRIVYTLTYGNVPRGKIVCHRCGNPSCCNPKHLYAGTFSDNNMDRVRHGKQAGGANKGSKHHMAKLKRRDITEIRGLRASGSTLPEIAKRYGVGISQIHRIVTRKSWRHV